MYILYVRKCVWSWVQIPPECSSLFIGKKGGCVNVRNKAILYMYMYKNVIAQYLYLLFRSASLSARVSHEGYAKVPPTRACGRGPRRRAL